MWGLLGTFGKTGFERGLEPGEFLSLRFLVSAAALVGYVVVTDPRSLKLPAPKAWRLVVLGLFGTSLFCTLYFEALRRLPASLCVLIFYSNPAMIAAGGWLLFGQKPGKRTLISLPLALAGVVLLVLPDIGQGSSVAGVLLCLVSAVIYSGYVLAASRWLKDVKPMVTSSYILVVGAVSQTLAHLRSPARAVEAMTAAWDVILGVSAFATIVPMILLFWGLNKLRPAEVGVLSTVEPVMGVILAVLILGEHLTMIQAAGGAIVVGTLVFMAFEAPPGPSIADGKELLVSD